VWAWPCESRDTINALEGFLFHQFNAQNRLMNGTIPASPGALPFTSPDKAYRSTTLSYDRDPRVAQSSSLRYQSGFLPL
jgi:hypothetical protein